MIWDVYPGSWIPDPDFFSISDPDAGSSGKKSTGSRIQNPEQQNWEILVNSYVIFLLLGNCDGQIRGGGFSEGQGLLLSGLRLHGARSHGAH